MDLFCDASTMQCVEAVVDEHDALSQLEIGIFPL